MGKLLLANLIKATVYDALFNGRELSNRDARQRGSLHQAHYKIFTVGNSYPLTFSNSKIRRRTNKFSTAVDLHSYR